MVVKAASVSTAAAPHENREVALKNYAQTLHDYTQQQWLDARRQAELAAQQGGSASSPRSHSANGFMRKSKQPKKP